MSSNEAKTATETPVPKTDSRKKKSVKKTLGSTSAKRYVFPLSHLLTLCVYSGRHLVYSFVLLQPFHTSPQLGYSPILVFLLLPLYPHILWYSTHLRVRLYFFRIQKELAEVCYSPIFGFRAPFSSILNFLPLFFSYPILTPLPPHVHSF